MNAMSQLKHGWILMTSSESYRSIKSIPLKFLTKLEKQPITFKISQNSEWKMIKLRIPAFLQHSFVSLCTFKYFVIAFGGKETCWIYFNGILKCLKNVKNEECRNGTETEVFWWSVITRNWRQWINGFFERYYSYNRCQSKTIAQLIQSSKELKKHTKKILRWSNLDPFQITVSKKKAKTVEF